MLDGLNQSVRELLSRATGMWPPAGGRHAVKLGDDSKLYLVLACGGPEQQSYEISATVEETLDKIVASRHGAKPAVFERAVDVTVPADNQSAKTLVDALTATDGGILRCPKCSGEFLHHGTVDVGPRPREDEPAPRMIVRSDGSYFTVVRSNYYRGRRDEVVIDFTCEDCEQVGRLAIIQHKGSTYINWELGDEAVRSNVASDPQEKQAETTSSNNRHRTTSETDVEIELVRRNAGLSVSPRRNNKWLVRVDSYRPGLFGSGENSDFDLAFNGALRDFDARLVESVRAQREKGDALACLAILVDANAVAAALVNELTPHVARLKELRAGAAPKHYTIADAIPELGAPTGPLAYDMYPFPNGAVEHDATPKVRAALRGEK